MSKAKKKAYQQKTNQIRHEYIVKKREQSYNPYSHAEAEQLLPKVGDHLMRTPASLDTQKEGHMRKRPCVVVEVNPFGLWYRVRFLNGGYCECFKVPDI